MNSLQNVVSYNKPKHISIVFAVGRTLQSYYCELHCWSTTDMLSKTWYDTSSLVLNLVNKSYYPQLCVGCKLNILFVVSNIYDFIIC